MDAAKTYYETVSAGRENRLIGAANAFHAVLKDVRRVNTPELEAKMSLPLMWYFHWRGYSNDQAKRFYEEYERRRKAWRKDESDAWWWSIHANIFRFESTLYDVLAYEVYTIDLPAMADWDVEQMAPVAAVRWSAQPTVPAQDDDDARRRADTMRAIFAGESSAKARFEFIQRNVRLIYALQQHLVLERASESVSSAMRLNDLDTLYLRARQLVGPEAVLQMPIADRDALLEDIFAQLRFRYLFGGYEATARPPIYWLMPALAERCGPLHEAILTQLNAAAVARLSSRSTFARMPVGLVDAEDAVDT